MSASGPSGPLVSSLSPFLKVIVSYSEMLDSGRFHFVEIVQVFLLFYLEQFQMSGIPVYLAF